MNWFKTHAPQLACLLLAAVLYVLVLAGKLTATTADEVTGGLLLIGLHLPKITYPAIKPPVGPTGLLALALGIWLFAAGVTLGASHVSDTAERVSADVISVAPVACTQQQAKTALSDGTKTVADTSLCIIKQILSGNVTPPGIALACAGVTATDIVAAVDHFTASPAPSDAGAAMMALQLTDQQRALLDQAKANAMRGLAAESRSP